MALSHDDQEYLKLGKMIADMIAELKYQARTHKAPGYGRRNITDRSGATTIFFLVTDAELADNMEAALTPNWDRRDITPPSEVH